MFSIPCCISPGGWLPRRPGACAQEEGRPGRARLRLQTAEVVGRAPPDSRLGHGGSEVVEQPSSVVVLLSSTRRRPSPPARMPGGEGSTGTCGGTRGRARWSLHRRKSRKTHPLEPPPPRIKEATPLLKVVGARICGVAPSLRLQRLQWRGAAPCSARPT